jgi:hypothetical protein
VASVQVLRDSGRAFFASLPEGADRPMKLILIVLAIAGWVVHRFILPRLGVPT